MKICSNPPIFTSLEALKASNRTLNLISLALKFFLATLLSNLRININTKKGKPGFHKKLEYTTGSYGTHNLSTSISGADEKRNFFVGFERFHTDGISAMSHNSEKDRYRNNGLVASYNNSQVLLWI